MAKKIAPEGEIAIIDENLLKSKVHTIRGVKVMLDADGGHFYGSSEPGERPRRQATSIKRMRRRL